MLLLVFLAQPPAQDYRQKAENHERSAAKYGVLGGKVRVHFLKIDWYEAADDAVAPAAE